MKNRTISRSLTLVLVMAFIMLFALSPDLVNAAQITTPLVFTDSTPTDSGDGWAWDLPALTLTLSGIDIAVTSGDAISLPANSTIDLIGINTVVNTDTVIGSGGIRGANELDITGTGVLNITAGYTGIHMLMAGLLISGATVNIDAGDYGILFNNATLVIDGGGAVNINAGKTGITDLVSLTTSGLWVRDGSFTSIGGTVPFNASLASMMTTYTWWANTAASDPGGAGTLSSTTPYTHSVSYKYVRIVSGTVGEGLIFDTVTTKFYYDINGDESLDAGDTTYLDQSGAWSWDQSTSTLNLNGFTYNVTGVYTALTIVGGALTINLSGTNTFAVDQTPGDGLSSGIDGSSCMGLTIKGSGTLNAKGGSSAVYTDLVSNGIFSYGLNIESGTVNATGGNVIGSGISYGVYANGDVIVNSGGTLNATSGTGAGASIGLSIVNADLKINGGTVNAISGTSGSDSVGFYIFDGNASINGGTLSAVGGATTFSIGSYGVKIDPTATLAITGSTLIASGQNSAIDSAPNISALSRYAYWTSASASDPGGNGTIVPGGTGYTWSINHKYLKITTEITTGTTTGGAAKTGDNSNMYVWSALALISVLGICVAVRKRRSEEK